MTGVAPARTAARAPTFPARRHIGPVVLVLLLAALCPILDESPAEPGMTDAEARLTLARTLSWNDATLAESAREYERLLTDAPETVEPRLEYARVLLRLKRYEDARRQLAAILEHAPGHPAALLELARSHLWSGEAARAIPILTALADRADAPADSARELARALAWGGRPAEATLRYDTLLAAASAPDPVLLEEAADAYAAAGSLAHAITLYGRALDLAPGSLPLRRKLVRAQNWTRQDAETEQALALLFQQTPHDREVGLDLAQVYIRRRRPDQLLPLLEQLSRAFPNDLAVLAAMADWEAALGHVPICESLYRNLIILAPDPTSFQLRLAEHRLAWGDYLGASYLCRSILAASPDDTAARLLLAKTLAAAQRYPEAEAEYARLRQAGSRPGDAADTGLAVVKRLDGQADWVSAWAEARSRTDPPVREAVLWQAEARNRAGDITGAVAQLTAYLDRATRDADTMAVLADYWVGAGRPEAAAPWVATALQIDPAHIPSKFLALGQSLVVAPEFLEQIRRAEPKAPGSLQRWGEFLAGKRLFGPAIRFFEAKVRQDPNCLPARISLAETLAADRRFGPSLDVYAALAADFPENHKILLGRARVLSWTRAYDESLALYDRLHQLDPSDPVSRREQARVAFWAKRPALGLGLYASLCRPAVDQLLLDRVAPALAGSPHANLVQRLHAQVDQGTIYEGYERFRTSLAANTATNNTVIRTAGQAVNELTPLYTNQKRAALEKRAKDLAWNLRFTRAGSAFADLVAAEPANLEARFDQGQAWSSAGLPDRAQAAYRALLVLDAQHNLAGLALEGAQRAQRPFGEAGYRFWQEDGYGDLARIRRHDVFAAGAASWRGRVRLRAEAHEWFEHPGFSERTYSAFGPALLADAQPAEWFACFGAWARKTYQDDLDPTDTGRAGVRASLLDAAHLTLGFDRTDELYNEFGLRQKTQADAWSAAPEWRLNRNLALFGEARFLAYNDDNRGQHHRLAAEFALSDHPRAFTLGLVGIYRDTRDASVSVFDAGGGLTNIVHPYWTPKDYWAASASLAWRHDLAALEIAEAPRHYYGLRLTTGTDTDDNPSIEGRAEWHLEFLRRWTIHVAGMLHQSREWKAEGAEARLACRF